MAVKHSAQLRHLGGAIDALHGACTLLFIYSNFGNLAYFNLGSSASRNASVNSENAVTNTAIATLAAVNCHHLPRISSFCASFNMLPHETTPTGTPNPRKLKITSDLMKPTTRIDTCTSDTWLTFGKM